MHGDPPLQTLCNTRDRIGHKTKDHNGITAFCGARQRNICAVSVGTIWPYFGHCAKRGLQLHFSYAKDDGQKRGLIVWWWKNRWGIHCGYPLTSGCVLRWTVGAFFRLLFGFIVMDSIVLLSVFGWLWKFVSFGICGMVFWSIVKMVLVYLDYFFYFLKLRK